MSEAYKQLADVFSGLAEGLESGSFGERFPIGLTVPGSEHGNAELQKAARLAAKARPDLSIVLIGGEKIDGFEHYDADTMEAAHKKMEELFKNGTIKAAVTLHYNFPLGVSTVGKVATPARGKDMIIATTTGSTDTNRYKAMLLNALGGIATAKADGIKEPTVGILNIDGAPTIERALKRLADNGYPINFVESSRADGGVRMRGNDLLQGTPDVMVCDTLTGNLLIKLFSSFMTGGSFEANGYGYGPCVGTGYDDVVGIISRASGAPVIANALGFVADCARRNVHQCYKTELELAKKAGLDEVLESMPGAKPVAASADDGPVSAPPKKVVNHEFAGIDILMLEDACQALWKAGIYAETGMGCTGPVILIDTADTAASEEVLKKGEYI